MNIALPAIIIVLIVLPGVLLRYSYRKGMFQRSSVTLGPITEEVAWGAVAALCIHGVAMLIVELCLNIRIDLQSLVILLTQWPKDDPASTQKVWDAIQKDGHEYYILSYLVTTNVAAWGLGYLAHNLVTACYLDIIYWKLRSRSGDWHYLLTGQQELIDNLRAEREKHLAENYSFWLRIQARRKDPIRTKKQFNVVKTYKKETPLTFQSIIATAIVHNGGKNYFYEGSVSDYYFSRLGDLDALVLSPWRFKDITAASENGDLGDNLNDTDYELKNDSLDSGQVNLDEEELGDDSYDVDDFGGHWVIKNSTISALNIDTLFLREVQNPKNQSNASERKGLLTKIYTGLIEYLRWLFQGRGKKKTLGKSILTSRGNFTRDPELCSIHTEKLIGTTTISPKDDLSCRDPELFARRLHKNFSPSHGVCVRDPYLR